MQVEARNNANWAGGARAPSRLVDGARAPSRLAAVALPTALFGLHTFILMGAGVQGDVALTGGIIGSLQYYAREAMLLAGFLLYGLFAWGQRAHALSGKAATGGCVLLAVLFVVCALVMQAAPQGVLLVFGVLVMELLVGFAGGAVYKTVALLALRGSAAAPTAPTASGAEGAACARPSHGGATRMLGAIVGVGGALAVVVQYLLQIRFSLGGWFAVVLAACFCLLVYLLRAASRERAALCEPSAGTIGSAAERKQVLFLVAVVACLFASFPFYEVVISDVFASADFYQWHRLFLIAGYLAIGAAAFFGGRAAASLAIAIAAPFTAFILAQAALLQTGPFTMALFYALLGAVVAYSGIAFMSLAPLTARPALAASGGRILEGAVTIAGIGIVALAGEWSAPAVLLSASVLIALMIVLMIRGGFFASAKGDGSQAAIRQAQGDVAGATHGAVPDKGELAVDATGAAGLPADAEASPVDEARIAAIVERYGLTRRETDVLGLVFRGLTVQEMADELVVTKSTVKYHVTNILKKTGAETRQQLLDEFSEQSQGNASP